MSAWDVPRTDQLPAGRSPALLFAGASQSGAALLGQNGGTSREARRAKGDKGRGGGVFKHAEGEIVVARGGSRARKIRATGPAERNGALTRVVGGGGCGGGGGGVSGSACMRACARVCVCVCVSLCVVVEVAVVAAVAPFAEECPACSALSQLTATAGLPKRSPPQCRPPLRHFTSEGRCLAHSTRDGRQRQERGGGR